MLKQFRTSRKMTQKEFANYLGIPRTTYSSYERGYRKPSIERQRFIESAIKMIKTREMAAAYYSALSREKSRPTFLSKRKLLKLFVMFLIILILVVLY